MKATLQLLFALFATISLAQNTTPFITVDQFGYLPEAEKIAVIRNPKVGYDESLEFNPGSTYQVIDLQTNEPIFTGSLTKWNGGLTDQSSGDQVWYFDFSEVNQVGNYVILDENNEERSFEFAISKSVYNEVLKHAMRTFFYQRAGYDKLAEYAGVAWADAASHVGSNQDTECRRFDAKNDPSTARDLSGGWYDAGDYNKYTNWTANYVVDMLLAYLERPEAWGDDYNLPYSGNEVPDIIDEVKWGIDHLKGLQNEDGSVLSIVGLAHGSPPSAATDPSYYGPESTSATLNTTAAFALAATVFDQLGMDEEVADLTERATSGWNWSVEHPNVLFRNNDSTYGSQGLGAGQQEESDYQRSMSKLEAAIYLFELTDDADFKEYVDTNYTACHLIDWNYAYPFESFNQDMLLHYTNLSNATMSVKDHILEVYTNQMLTGNDNMPAIETKKDPYMAYVKDYTWGSNSIKSRQANMFHSLSIHSSSSAEKAIRAASGYMHYMHGVNPLNIVYLSNMYDHGAENAVNQFYHSWFTDGSTKWDRVGESIYGPAPGFLVGGPNPGYAPDNCCPDGCGSSGNNAVCDSEELSPPTGQPDQKSYKDFNTSWPLNSWSVSENSNGYQLAYIRLLSKYVDLNYDCMGVEGGQAFIDACGRCAGGTSALTPVSSEAECRTVLSEQDTFGFVYPNPVSDVLRIDLIAGTEITSLKLYNLSGALLKRFDSVQKEVDLSDLTSGTYILNVQTANKEFEVKVIKE